jgi:transposase
MGVEVWCEDEAGPYQAIPQEGASWQPECEPRCRPHEYERGGTAKMLTLFHPQSGKLIVKGVTSSPNIVLHSWLKENLSTITNKSTTDSFFIPESERGTWTYWQEGLKEKITLPEKLPKLKVLLILDNLKGHKSVDFVLWLFENGIMPLYTPLGGSWLNMAESIQNIVKKRALNGQHPKNPEEIMKWLEVVAKHWNEDPTPFTWEGKRYERRIRSKERRRNLKGSGAQLKSFSESI